MCQRSACGDEGREGRLNEEHGDKRGWMHVVAHLSHMVLRGIKGNAPDIDARHDEHGLGDGHAVLQPVTGPHACINVRRTCCSCRKSMAAELLSCGASEKHTLQPHNDTTLRDRLKETASPHQRHPNLRLDDGHGDDRVRLERGGLCSGILLRLEQPGLLCLC